MKQLPSRLKHARQKAQLSQKELGEKLGISEMAISAYETGRAIPPIPALKKISEITKLPFSYFIAEKKKQISLESLHIDIQKIKKDVSQVLKLLQSYAEK